MKILNLLLLLTSIGSAFAGGTPQTCEFLKRSVNPQDKSINIVIVPSGFQGDMQLFSKSVRELWPEVAEYMPFSENVTTMNVVIASVPNVKDDDYCEFNEKIDRLLTCDGIKASKAAAKCMSSDNRYVITIQNTTKHGGSGARHGASATLARSSAEIIAHELGHSIFKLADEYTYDGWSAGKNCSKKSTCDDWKDLIDAGLATCEPGCKGGAFFTSSKSLMGNLSEKSFGHVNRRLICCEFKKQTDEYPSFCDQYHNVGVGLDNYCR